MSSQPGSSHYFSDSPSVASRPRRIVLQLPEGNLEVTTDRGVFSGAQLDPGTRVLLDGADLPAIPGDVLDLGCGYGPIALSLARRLPDRMIWAVDVNDRALDLARQNAEEAAVANMRVCRPEEVSADMRFAAIYSNPPIRIGKAASRELLALWLERLQPGGTACLVVAKHLGADSLGKWIESLGRSVTKKKGKRDFVLLTVGMPPDQGAAYKA